MRAFSICIGLFFFGSLYGTEYDAPPHWPNLFSKFDAQTYGMGDSYIFSTGPASIYLNPARIGSKRYILLEGGYEWRNGAFDNGDIFWGKDIANIPQFVGVTYPLTYPYRKISFGMDYAQLCKLQQPAFYEKDGIYDEEILRNFSIGFSSLLTEGFNIGMSIGFVLGGAHLSDSIPSIISYYEDYNVNGGYGVIGGSFQPNPKLSIAFRIHSPMIIKGDHTYYLNNFIDDTTYYEVNPAESKYFYPCIASFGILRTSSPVHRYVIQIDYIGWRGQLVSGYEWPWGKDEWDIHLGVERKIGNVFTLRGGFIPSFFPDKTNDEDVSKFFLTGGLGINLPFGIIDIGTGIGNELWPLNGRTILLVDVKLRG